jgi:dihydroorotate dehydrogenase (fumarate)
MAITGGVHVVEDVVKSMMAGAKVAMMTSVLLEHGIDYLKTLNADLNGWLDKHEYDSIEQMQGSMSQKNVAHPAAFERANYMKVLNSYSVK